jgi:hypothetical protein
MPFEFQFTYLKHSSAMKKETAQVLNSIPNGVQLEDYFKTLSFSEKEELIQELTVCKEHFSKDLTPYSTLAALSFLVSAACFFGIREAWFAFYLILLNIPLSIFYYLKIKRMSTYKAAIAHLRQKR